MMAEHLVTKKANKMGQQLVHLTEHTTGLMMVHPMDSTSDIQWEVMSVHLKDYMKAHPS
eukprot:CAMPEP_0185026420 /NCGR_PEP_ID=MMETSP1103-20130426/10581_1 /TAXON_ID=36769 /ORGANISM="Paraphysomonas bandaiensis, Strain Caron Lab Isolate" /LENGTH=58 /DNA_ID=CAMNT_0027559993 /DNA_START=78 /DNA_END=251 /DNA_ORIENTATION=+